MSGPNKRSSAEALAVLHQLSSNPQMLNQLQNVLSLLNNNSNNSEEDDQASYGSGLSHEPVSSSLSSPAVTLEPVPTRGALKQDSTRGGARPSAHATTHTAASTSTVPLARYEQLLQRCKTAEEAAETWAQRFRTSEADVEQLTRDVRLLDDKLEEQRRLYKQLEGKRESDLVNAERIYNAALRRQDEVHEEAVRQLMKAHQLQQTAARYEAAVQQKVRTGLSAATTPINVRHTAGSHAQSQKGSGSMAGRGSAHIKRERSDVEEVEEEEGGFVSGAKGSADSGAKKLRTEHGRMPTSRSTNTNTASSWKNRSSQILLKDDNDNDNKGHSTRDVPRRRSPHSGRTDVTGAFASSLATTTRSRYQSDEKPAHRTEAGVDARSGKSGSDASARVAGGRRTVTRRRTPLTPTMTHADRLHASRSPLPTGARTVLPTGSWKLDSPLSRNVSGEAERGVSPMPVTTASAMARYQTQAPRTEEETKFVSQYASAAKLAPATTATKPTVLSQKMAAARLPGPTVADGSVALSPRPLSPVTAPSTGALSGASSAVASGPTRSPSPLNPKRGPAMIRRFIFTGLQEDDIVQLHKAIETIGDQAEVLDAGQDAPPPAETTHIVLRGTPRSVKAMCGVVSSRWLVSPEYVYNSLKVGFWLDEFEEGGLRFFPSPVKCQRFLLTMGHDDIRRKLEQVVEYGGGEVVNGLGNGRGPSGLAQDVVVVSCGDDLLRFATQARN